MYSAVIQVFHRLFYYLEQEGVLNPKHLFALHYIFIPRINSALSEFVGAWNRHPVSGCQGQSPVQLYTRAMIELRQKNLPSFDFFEPVTDSYGECDDEDLIPDEEGVYVAVDPIDFNFDIALLNHINPLNISANYGINLFEQVFVAVENMET